MNNIHYYSLFFFPVWLAQIPRQILLNHLAFYQIWETFFLICNEITSIEQPIARKRDGNRDDWGSRVRQLSFFFVKLEKTNAETFTSFEKTIAQLLQKSIATKWGKKLKKGTLVETAAIRHNVNEWFRVHALGHWVTNKIDWNIALMTSNKH